MIMMAHIIDISNAMLSTDHLIKIVIYDKVQQFIIHSVKDYAVESLYVSYQL